MAQSAADPGDPLHQSEPLGQQMSMGLPQSLRVQHETQ